MLRLAREPRLLQRVALVAAHRLGRSPPDSACAAAARSASDASNAASRRAAACLRWRRQPELFQLRQDRLVQRGHAVVVEARRHRAEHQHLVRLLAEVALVALNLLADVAQRVGRALAIELVDRNEVGEVEHVDLLELARGAVFRRHHIQRAVDVLHDRGVALPDARRFDDHQIETRDLARGDRVGQRLRNFLAGFARGERAHVDLRSIGPRIDRVHADAIAEQRAAALAARRVDRDHRDLQLVALIEANAAHQLVAQARLARAAGAGDAERRHLRGVGCLVQRFAKLGIGVAQFQRGDRARQSAPALGQILVFQCVERLSARSGDRSTSHSATIDPIIPCRPSFCPSSGEKMRATP